MAMTEVLATDFLDALCAQNQALLAADAAVAVVVAHPDDEVIGLGSRLRRLFNAQFVHVTDGAPRDLRDTRRAGFTKREDYALARRRELHSALEVAGIAPKQTLEIGIVDQEASLRLVGLSLRLAE